MTDETITPEEAMSVKALLVAIMASVATFVCCMVWQQGLPMAVVIAAWLWFINERGV
jgi:hypothetical protein